MRRHTIDAEVLGPWSVTTSRAFWEGFSPSALDDQRAGDGIRTVFRVEADWSRVEVQVTQRDHVATISLDGAGDLEAAADQVRRFRSLDVDARGWPDVARRDRVIAAAQDQLPGLRPCGFLVDRHGDDGAFPAPRVLRAHSPYEAAAWPWTSICPDAGRCCPNASGS